MKIGIVGIGSVGGSLGTGLARRGHQVVFGSRRPESSDAKALVLGAGENARAGTVADAFAFGATIVLATPWTAVRDVLAQAGPLAGKVILDATNPFSPQPGGLGLALPWTTSGAEEVAKLAPGAHVAKAFSTMGFEVMEDPRFPEGPASNFLAGDEEAKQVAATLSRDIGFEPVDLGPLAEAKLVEVIALAWVKLAHFRGEGRGIAFRLMRR